MATRKVKDYAPDGDYMLGAHQWAKALERDTGFIVQVGLSPEGQQGVWRVVLRVRHRVDAAAGATVCQIRGTWPNANPAGFGAFLMGLTAELDRKVAEEMQGVLLRS